MRVERLLKSSLSLRCGSLRGNDDDAVYAARTVHGRVGRILQHLDLRDLLWFKVETVPRLNNHFRSVDDVQRGAIAY